MVRRSNDAPSAGHLTTRRMGQDLSWPDGALAPLHLRRWCVVPM